MEIPVVLWGCPQGWKCWWEGPGLQGAITQRSTAPALLHLDAPTSHGRISSGAPWSCCAPWSCSSSCCSCRWVRAGMWDGGPAARGVRQEDGARISLGCWAAGSEAKGRRWQQNIPPEHEENCVGGWGLEQAAWRVVESPSLQALRILVDTILISVLEGTLSSKGADPTLTPLWVCLPLWCLQNCFFCPAPGLKSLGGAFQGWGPSAHPAGNTRGLPPGWARWWPCHINHHPPRNSMSFHECFCGIHAPALGYSFLEVPLAGMETALPWAVAMEVNKRSGKARKYTVKASKMIKNDYTRKRGKQQGKNLEQIQQRQLASAELQPCLLFFTWQSFLCM